MPKGFQVLPRRWVVKRTFAWLGHSRRLSKDDEELPATEKAWITSPRACSCSPGSPNDPFQTRSNRPRRRTLPCPHARRMGKTTYFCRHG